MAHTSVLAQRYAEGLMRVVRDSGRFRETSGELHGFLDLFDIAPKMRVVMMDPSYSAGKRQSLLDDVRGGQNLSEPTYGLLRLLIAKRRIDRVEEVVAAFDGLWRKELGIVQADVYVAEDIDSTTRAQIEQVVRNVSGGTPELTVHKDPSILGGVKVRMGNTILDATLTTKLEKLHESLLQPATAAG